MPPTSKALTKSELAPRMNPKPEPNTNAPMIIKKNAVSMPAVPAPKTRITAFRAISTPKTASCLLPRPPLENSTSTTTKITGINPMKTDCARRPSSADSAATNRGQVNITKLASPADASIADERTLLRVILISPDPLSINLPRQGPLRFVWPTRFRGKGFPRVFLL